MEFVPGEDLKSTLRRVGHLSVGKTISIAKLTFKVGVISPFSISNADPGDKQTTMVVWTFS
jgi:hypothetical protein